MNIRQVAEDFASRHVAECELMLEGLAVLIPMEDELRHTVAHPFCDERDCPCHWDSERIYQFVPPAMVLDGLMTEDELDSLYWGKSI